MDRSDVGFIEGRGSATYVRGATGTKGRKLGQIVGSCERCGAIEVREAFVKDGVHVAMRPAQVGGGLGNICGGRVTPRAR